MNTRVPCLSENTGPYSSVILANTKGALRFGHWSDILSSVGARTNLPGSRKLVSEKPVSRRSWGQGQLCSSTDDVLQEPKSTEKRHGDEGPTQRKCNHLNHTCNPRNLKLVREFLLGVWWENGHGATSPSQKGKNGLFVSVWTELFLRL